MSFDTINPKHYRQGDIECIDAIKAALTPDEYRGYLKGNVMKYIWRENHKGGVDSLRKAMWYLERLILASGLKIQEKAFDPLGDIMLFSKDPSP